MTNEGHKKMASELILNTKARYKRRLPWEAQSSFASQLKRVLFKFNMAGDSNSRNLKGQCHAIWQLNKNLEGVFASTEFQN